MDGIAFLTLALGIPIGALGTLIYDVVCRLVQRVRFGKLAIRGTWFEWVPNGGERPFSIGRIRYNFIRRQFAFDGTNYRLDGSAYCHWRTVSSHIDFSTNELHYVFATKDVQSLSTSSYGYGVVSLMLDKKRLVPVGGAYMYSLGQGSAIQMDHTMVRVSPDGVPGVGANVKKYCEKVLKSQGIEYPYL